MGYYTQQKAEALTDAFLNAWKAGVMAGTAMRAAADLPSPRFWVSAETMQKRIKDFRERKGEWKTPAAAEMTQEVIRRCNGDYSLTNLERVLEQPAPKFYIKGDTARKLIQRELKRRRRCRRKQ